MSNATTNDRPTPEDTLHLERPDNITPERWADIRDRVDRTIAIAQGRCPDHAWCVMAADPRSASEHREFCSGDTIQLTGELEEPGSSWCYLVESHNPVKPGVRVVLGGRLKSGQPYESELSTTEVAEVLAATRTKAARQAMWDVLTGARS